MTLKEYLLENLHNYDGALVEPIRTKVTALENQIGTKAVYTVDEILTNDVNYPTLEDALNDLFNKTTSSSSVTQNDIISNITVGGIPSGTTITKGTELERIVTEMLVAYLQPSIKVESPSNTIMKVGTAYAPDIICSVTEKSLPIQYVDFFVNGVSILRETNIAQGANNLKLTYKSNGVGYSTATSIYCEAFDGKTTVKSNTVSINFVYPIYYGVVSGSLDENSIQASDITALNSPNPQTGRGFTYSNIVANKQKVVFAYPKSYGALSSIKDGNGLTYEARDLGSTVNKSFVKQTMQINSVDYLVYMLVKPTILLSVDKFKFIFA